MEPSTNSLLVWEELQRDLQMDPVVITAFFKIWLKLTLGWVVISVTLLGAELVFNLRNYQSSVYISSSLCCPNGHTPDSHPSTLAVHVRDVRPHQ